MAWVIDLWQKLGQSFHLMVNEIFGPSQQSKILEEKVKNLEEEIQSLISEKLDLENQVERQAKEIHRACQSIIEHEVVIEKIKNDYEQDALYFMEFRQLSVNFIRAYHTSFTKRRAAISMLAHFLEESLEITNEEIYQKDKQGRSLPIEDAVQQLKNFLANFQPKIISPETLS